METAEGRSCRWCKNCIGDAVRADAVFCRVECRQAHFRFTRAHETARRCRVPIKVAYADPPYPGKAVVYADRPEARGEVDYLELVDRLRLDFPDGWALSTSAESLPRVLRICPVHVRVCAWFRGVRPAATGKLLNAWEPVIVWGGRRERRSLGGRRVDALEYTLRARRGDELRVIGAKPGTFCFWLFDLLGLLPGDAFHDLFPGSGRVGYAWEEFTGGAAAGAASGASQRGGPAATVKGVVGGVLVNGELAVDVAADGPSVLADPADGVLGVRAG
jgi:hypothetical protein